MHSFKPSEAVEQFGVFVVLGQIVQHRPLVFDFGRYDSSGKGQPVTIAVPVLVKTGGRNAMTVISNQYRLGCSPKIQEKKLNPSSALKTSIRSDEKLIPRRAMLRVLSRLRG